MTTFCGHCGARREKKDKFCIQCGASFQDAPKSSKKADGTLPEAELPKKDAPGGKTPKAKQALFMVLGMLLVGGGVVGVFVAASRMGGHESTQTTPAENAQQPMLSCVGEANALRDAKKPAEAVAKMEECRDRFPTEGYVFWYLGETYDQNQQVCEAHQAYNKAAELYGQDPVWGAQARTRAEETKARCSQ